MPIKTTLKEVYRRLPFKRNLFEILRKAPFPEKVFRHLSFEGPFDVAVDPSHKFSTYHFGTSFENKLFWLGLSSYEQTSIELWRGLAAKASVIVDGGANTGLYSLIAGAVNPSATILAFEPVQTVFERLETNVDLNQFSVKVEKLALSDATGTATFYVSPGEHPVSSTLDRIGASIPGVETVTVHTVRLDDYLIQHHLAGVELLKLDVEGHESAVLRGMGLVLSRSRPIIIAEVNNAALGSQIVDVISGQSYRFFIIKEGEAISEVSALSPPPGKWGQNFLLCPEEAAPKLGL